jgi:Ulp1 family protease
MNTLNGEEPSSSPVRNAPSSSQQAEDPPAKRQKLDGENMYTDVMFRFDGTNEIRPTRRRSIDSSHSRSVQSSSTKANQSGIEEFRRSQKHVAGPKPRRLRHKQPQSNSAEDPQEIQDSEEEGDEEEEEEEVQLVQPPLPKQSDLPEVPGEQFASRFRQQKNQVKPDFRSAIVNTAKRKIATEHTASSKRARESSPDPLAQESLPNVSSKPESGPSSSESRRGVLQRTNFISAKSVSQRPQERTKLRYSTSEQTNAKHIIGFTGLSLHRGVSGHLGFPGANDPLELTLQVHEISTILLPTSEDGNVLDEYKYLAVDMKAVHRMKFSSSPKHHIVSIRRSLNPSWTATATLHLEFKTARELELFEEWANMERNEPLPFVTETVDGEKLQKELLNLAGKTTASKALLDRDDHVVTDAAKPLDMRILEKNRQTRGQNAPISTRKSTRIDPSSTQRKLKDGMQIPDQLAAEDKPLVIPQSPKRSGTRLESRASRLRSSRAANTPEILPKGWTEDNPDWAEQWRNSLVYPAQGKNRATVDKDDIARLDEGQFLNDNLIIFYLRHLQHQLEIERPDLAQRIYFHNTFFYDKLKPSKSGAGINYDSVKGWTSKVDLFTKDFIVVPINEYSHWYVAIIYNAPKLVPGQAESEPNVAVSSSPTEPITVEDETATAPESTTVPAQGYSENITSLVERRLQRMSIDSSDEGNRPIAQKNTNHDHGHAHAQKSTGSKDVIDLEEGHAEVEEVKPTSFGGRKKGGRKSSLGLRKHDPSQPKIITLDSLGASHSPACTFLRQYLVQELKDKRGIEISDPGALGMTAKDVPCQMNYCDCGLYLLGYIERFIQDPDTVVHSLLQHREIDWKLEPSHLRHGIRKLIFDLQATQQQREDVELGEKRQRAVLRKLNKGSRPSSSEGPDANQRSAISNSPVPNTASKLVTGEGEGARALNGNVRSHQPSSIDASSLLRRGKHDIDSVKNSQAIERRDLSAEPQPRVRAATHHLSPTPKGPTERSAPGAFPSSPPVATRHSTAPPSKSLNDNASDGEGFLQPIQPPSSPDKEPSNPVDLVNSIEDEIEPTPSRWQATMADPPRRLNKIQVEIHSSRTFNKNLATEGTGSARLKQTPLKSRHFPTTQSKQIGDALVSVALADDSVEEVPIVHVHDSD